MKILIIAFKHIHKAANSFFYLLWIELFIFIRIEIYLIEYVKYFLFNLFTFILNILLFLKAYWKCIRFTFLTIFSLLFLLHLCLLYLTYVKYWALINVADIFNDNILIELFPYNIQYLRLEFLEFDQLVE